MSDNTRFETRENEPDFENPVAAANLIRTALELIRNIDREIFRDEMFIKILDATDAGEVSQEEAIELVRSEVSREYCDRMGILRRENSNIILILDETERYSEIIKLLTQTIESSTDLTVVIEYISGMIQSVYPGKRDTQFITIESAWHKVLDALQPGLSQKELEFRNKDEG